MLLTIINPLKKIQEKLQSLEFSDKPRFPIEIKNLAI